MRRPRRQRVHLCGTPGCQGRRCPTGRPLLVLDDDEPTVLDALLTPEPLLAPVVTPDTGAGRPQRETRIVHAWGA